MALTRWLATGSAMDRGTDGRAPRCTTASAPANVASRASSSRTLPSTNSASQPSRFARCPLERSSSTTSLVDAGLLHQPVAQVGADEPCSPGDDNLHGAPRMWGTTNGRDCGSRPAGPAPGDLTGDAGRARAPSATVVLVSISSLLFWHLLFSRGSVAPTGRAAAPDSGGGTMPLTTRAHRHRPEGRRPPRRPAPGRPAAAIPGARRRDRRRAGRPPEDGSRPAARHRPHRRGALDHLARRRRSRRWRSWP